MAADAPRALRAHSKEFLRHPIVIAVVVALTVVVISTSMSWYIASAAFREVVGIKLDQIEVLAENEAQRQDERLSASLDRISLAIEAHTETLGDIDTRLRSVELDVRALQTALEVPPGWQVWYRGKRKNGPR